tara:strand:+ start:272 stop:463 length:192 start_codon:yes stop_codon:yes gene_type:complete
MARLNITSAEYVNLEGLPKNQTIKVNVGGAIYFIPTDPNNTDYAELMKLVEEDKITIEEVTEE